jgi:hypothetical protein
LLASDIATTADGRKVKLYENGTYVYMPTTNDNKMKIIDFADFMIESTELVGETIRIKGVGGFSNNSHKKYPSGSIYQKIFTIGPSISIDTTKLNNENLKKVHKCPLSCTMQIDGVIKKTTNKSQIIEATSIVVFDYNGSML